MLIELSVYIFKVVRNETTKFNYHEGKVNKWDSEPLEYLEYGDVKDEGDFYDVRKSFFSHFKRIEIEMDLDVADLQRYINTLGESVLSKAILWELNTENN